MSRRPLLAAPRILMALASSFALAACVVTPALLPTGGPGVTGDSKVSKGDVRKVASPSPATSQAVPSPTTSVEVAATPEPLPSLGLLVSGQVKLDPSAMLKLGIAERTPVGVKLISNNGPGLISDKGVGLISDKGVGLIANNSGSLVSNNSGSMVSKTKYAVSQAAATDRAPQPVQGLIVKAVSLRTGEVLAGPIATDAEGRYRLGFLAKPETNLQIVAYVNNKESEAAFNYTAFAPPAAQPITTTDTTDLICEYLIRVLAARVQIGIDARKRGEEVWLDPAQLEDEAERKQAQDVNDILTKITPEMATTIDQQGLTARKFAERSVSYADLGKPVYRELELIFDQLVAFNASLPTPPAPSVQEEVVRLLYDLKTMPQIPGTLQKYGMAQEQAESLAQRLRATAAELNAELARVGNEHPTEVLAPLLEIPGLTDYLPLFESPKPTAQP